MQNGNWKIKISSGYTLMEILVVIAIMTIILGISFYYFSGFGKKEALEKDVAGLVALLRNARMLSVTSKNAMPFGVHLESNRAVLFEGNTYTVGGANQKILEFSEKIYLHSYSLNGGGQDIIFARLSGSTSNYGSIILSLKDNSASATISILKTGVVQ